ncbi:MAG: hypothetical protein OHM56_02495 [Spiroplasma phoeniceum]|nr:MAG: hypothetical protein OHM57_01940 [Spiroplasma phoeniceum]UZQ32843.1 MAG: hypothetical protein OHM56_02495 [Spiroplasma phoeniceum]
MPIFNNPHDETIYLLTKGNEQIKAENNRLLAIPGFIIKILL